MTRERWQQIDRLFQSALEQELAGRAGFLDDVCGSDAELRSEVESLLASHEKAARFIEAPPDDIVAGMIAEEQARSVVGRTLGRYQIHSLLGAGGMGEVYRAHDTRLNRPVAVKILPEHLTDSAEVLRRFEREAKAVAALSHPNILAIHDFGVEEGVSYAVMELLEGETLRERLGREAMNWREAVEIGVAVAEGLAAAHAKGIIHRDLKPENIFLTTDGQVKILDFGIAHVKHAVSPEGELSLSTLVDMTKPGAVIGTMGYMSPEQVRGEEVEAPSDIFSFGSMLYEMVVGERPFARRTPAETIAAILKEEPRALSELKKGSPADLERIIVHCLEKRPERRFQSARDLAFDLRALLSGSGFSLPALLRNQPRVRLGIGIGAAVLGLLVALAVWLYLSRERGGAIDSLAVLPFVNAGADPNMDYLSDGLADSISYNLSQLPQLNVMARSSAMLYKQRHTDPQTAGRQLGVRAVVVGQVTPRGDGFAISAELVDVRNNRLLWGENYAPRLADALALQEEIAQRISEKLRLALTSDEKKRLTKRYTENPEAYQLYLKGRWYSLNLWTAEGFKKGIDYLKQAIAADPTYALAHAGLAATYYDASGVWLRPKEAMPMAKAAAIDALRLDDALAEGHTALAQVLAQYEWNWKEAGEHYRRAIELNPNFAQARLYYGMYLANVGRLEEGIGEMKQAQRLDPLSSITSALLAHYYYTGRKNDEAIAQCLKSIELDPKFYLTHSFLGLAYVQKGMLEQAIAEFNEAQHLDPEQPFTLGYLGYVYAKSGKRDLAQKMLDEITQRAKRTYVDPFGVAMVHAGLGEKDAAFAWLEKAYQERSETLFQYKDAPILDSLRTDPRFTDLLRRMNLAP